ncbi:MAG: transporter substrate-binding domain-containing protein [Ferrovibrio sp.]|uniref:substrate-binding periplasmic protein n=1 Tax=Ferrovibrio sp. TaxID=1917215 RepID=UPI002622F995|nr:transporter substrate-binding domain-containing protein [Ferrovibrio sp.]MCW0234597.1 transporter substrate-binding domain-containing protein [Ferrovibrio sp.]
MGIRSILICAMAVALGLAQPGHAADNPAAGRLALVSGEDYPPFADPRLPGGGLAVMLVRRVVEAMGATAKIDFMPWRRGYEETLRGRYDATFPYVRTAERERDFLYSDSLIQVRQVVFMSAGRRFSYRSPEDLRGRRACIALGYAPPAVLQAMLDRDLVARVTPASASACPGLVAADRADFFVQDERIGAATVARAGLADAIVTVGNLPFGSTDLHVIVPRDRPGAAELIRRFNDGLRRLRDSGDYEHLLLQ